MNPEEPEASIGTPPIMNNHEGQTPQQDANFILDPLKTSVSALETFLLQLEEDLKFEQIINIADCFDANEDYKMNFKDHHELLLLHCANAHLELKVDESLDKAKTLYKRAIDILPNSNTYSKFFSYAALLTGREAVTMYERGLKLVDAQISQQKELRAEYELTMQETDIDISCELKPVITKDAYEASGESVVKLEGVLQNVYTALGEIFVTDLVQEQDSLQIAMKYAEKAYNLHVDLEVLLLKFHVHYQEKLNLERYPNALSDAKNIISKMTLLLLSKTEGGSDVPTLHIQKCVNAAISLDCYHESLTMLSAWEKIAGHNNEVIMYMWASHHHASIEYHQRGFKHYSSRLKEVIRGLEKSREATDETKELKQWIEDLSKKTPLSIDSEENSSNPDETFVEMGLLSPGSCLGSIPEVTITDSENSDNENEEEDDDSCVIIEDTDDGTQDTDIILTSSQENEVKDSDADTKDATEDLNPGGE